MPSSTTVVPARHERALFWTVLVLFALFVAIHIGKIVLDIDVVPWKLLVPAFAGLGLMHAWHLLGAKRTIALFTVTVLVSTAMEIIGIKTGFPFGPYHYTDLLGFKVAGLVPVLIPFAYFMMAYPCYVITNLLCEGCAVTHGGKWLWRFWLAVLGGMLMTAWDLTMDPLMSCNPALAKVPCQAEPAWIWAVDGVYFGVPAQNFVGWVLTTGLVFLIYRSMEARLPHEPAGKHPTWFLLIPVASYGILAISDAFIGMYDDVRLISPFIMGIPAIAATLELVGPKARARAT